MSKTLKPLSTEIDLPDAVGNTVSNAVMVRLVNANSVSRVVTRSDSSNNTIGTFTILPSTEIFLSKYAQDQLHASNTDVKATSIAVLG